MKAMKSVHKLGYLSRANYSSLGGLAPKVHQFIKENADIMKPDKIHVCDGTDAENSDLLTLMTGNGMISKLNAYDNCWISRTDPADVARVESRTFITTDQRNDTIPTTKDGVKGVLGNWMSPKDTNTELSKRFPGCMKGRVMYVMPFSMGPVGSPLSKIGIQLTDSPYVVASMRIMTRMGSNVLNTLSTEDFIKCVHSIGQPLSENQKSAVWPCNPKETIISHYPSKNLISSFGSGYGGNSLMGKKCFALRIGSTIARDEGWLAEHMLILGITNPSGKKTYIAAAFPSACGKTNLAMLEPSLPGYKVECVGDDIAWMRFDDNGDLRAINPEAGFFGVAPGTSMSTNPNAMKTIQKNTIFTNVASTNDGQFYWEGLEKESDISSGVTSWLGEAWKKGDAKPAAHPNSRFCTPASQCPIIDSDWESRDGVKIDAILFGGRRPQGVPLIYESFNWNHGVFVGASMRSESTAAAEHKAKVIMNDPFAMRPFFGYNFGQYLSHWVSMQKPNRKMPKIFHVNWFSKSDKGKFLWPGFGENCRVLDWVCRRTEGTAEAVKTPIGYVPMNETKGINIDGLKDIDMNELLKVDKQFWINETKEIRSYFDQQLPNDLPETMSAELKALEDRLSKM